VVFSRTPVSSTNTDNLDILNEIEIIYDGKTVKNESKDKTSCFI
jgi:hypothetical protein